MARQPRVLRQRPANPQARYLRIEAALVAIAARSAPVSLRHIYYEMVATGVIEKTKANYGRLSDIAAKARRAGILPWEHIADRTRNAGGMPWWTEKEPPIEADVHVTVYGFQFEPSVWQYRDPPIHVELWTETRGMAGSLEDVASRFRVGTTAAGGMPSVSLAHEASRVMASSEAEEYTILYVGDADSHGWDIEDQIRAELDETFGLSVNWLRIALSDEEAKERGDPNAEVVPIEEMRARVATEIKALIGDDAPRLRQEAKRAHQENYGRVSDLVDYDDELRVQMLRARSRIQTLLEEAFGQGY